MLRKIDFQKSPRSLTNLGYLKLARSCVYFERKRWEEKRREERDQAYQSLNKHKRASERAQPQAIGLWALLPSSLFLSLPICRGRSSSKIFLLPQNAKDLSLSLSCWHSATVVAGFLALEEAKRGMQDRKRERKRKTRRRRRSKQASMSCTHSLSLSLTLSFFPFQPSTQTVHTQTNARERRKEGISMPFFPICSLRSISVMPRCVRICNIASFGILFSMGGITHARIRRSRRSTQQQLPLHYVSTYVQGCDKAGKRAA